MLSGMWIGVGGGLLGSVALGLSLAAYATGSLSYGVPAPSAIGGQVGNPDAAYGPDYAGAADSSGMQSPVVCKGCGPSLADRQMAANMASYPGYDDPVVRDYVLEGERLEQSTGYRASPGAERFDSARDRHEQVGAVSTDPSPIVDESTNAGVIIPVHVVAIVAVPAAADAGGAIVAGPQTIGQSPGQ